ncbi:hypothetical protein Tco_1415780, partial [Tanacetum coccineum]
MRKSSRNKKRAMENLNFFYQDIRTSSSDGGHLTQEEAANEAIPIKMSKKFAMLKEERPVIETMAYHDKYKKILDEIWKDKVELARMGKVNENALADTGSDINTMPYRIYETLVCHQTFPATRFDVLRTTESDSDDEEENEIKRNKFGALIYGPKLASYLNCTNPEDRSSTIQTLTGSLIIGVLILKKKKQQGNG